LDDAVSPRSAVSRLSMTRALAFACACTAAVILSGSVVGTQVYRGGTDVVLLSVTVSDSTGHPCAGAHGPGLSHLRRQRPAGDLAFFRSAANRFPSRCSSTPATAWSPRNKLGLAQQAANGFIARLGPKDVAQIVDFDSQTKILMPFTGDKDALAAGLKLAKPGGSTSLYNAIYTALSDLKRLRRASTAEVRRQAIILLSDGEDTSSLVPYDDVLELAKRNEVIVYAIGLVTKDQPATRGWNEAEFVLKTLTRDTGARAFFVADPAQLPAIYIQISEELASQYSVGYMSKNVKKDGTWRRITLQVLKGDAMARTRSGYFAPTEPK
jgi:Ca-activated chloride channel family protein